MKLKPSEIKAAFSRLKADAPLPADLGSALREHKGQGVLGASGTALIASSAAGFAGEGHVVAQLVHPFVAPVLTSFAQWQAHMHSPTEWFTAGMTVGVGFIAESVPKLWRAAQQNAVPQPQLDENV